MNDIERITLAREVHSLFRPGMNDKRTTAEAWGLLGHRFKSADVRRAAGWLVRHKLLSRPKNKAGGKIERRYCYRAPWPERMAV